MKRALAKWLYQQEDVTPYTRLAAVYDRVMNHVDYDKWADFIVFLFQKFGSDVCRVVDGGCGTGSLLHALVCKKMRVAGFDRSVEMVQLAKQKTQCPIWVDDLRTFCCKVKWDAFLCLYDTIQYLTTEEIQTLLHHIGEVLTPGGLFIFDVVTESHVLRYWANYTEKVEWNSLEMLRRSWYVKNRRSQHTEFEIIDKDHNKVYRERHIQYIYPLETFIKMSGESGLRFVGQFEDFTLNPGNEKSDRIHFVFRRAAI
ncbi:class I SAM-dependent methyltransferase [bacterium]|nr:class I SAM-dependent methyltransferase [bacterium]